MSNANVFSFFIICFLITLKIRNKECLLCLALLTELSVLQNCTHLHYELSMLVIWYTLKQIFKCVREMMLFGG